jgi:hypothetical protein
LKGGSIVTTSGKSLITGLSDGEALAGLRPGVTLFTSTASPITPVPAQFVQPSEVQEVYDGLKSVVDVAYPNDKQSLDEKRAKRKDFNETMGSFVDLVVLAARKQPDLIAKFELDFLFRARPSSGIKTMQYRIPSISLQVNDKQPQVIQGRVRGVKKAVEVFHAYDDPTNEGNWTHFDSYASATFTMTGLTSGKRTYVRARFIIGKDKKSPWSDMASIMVP